MTHKKKYQNVAKNRIAQIAFLLYTKLDKRYCFISLGMMMEDIAIMLKTRLRMSCLGVIICGISVGLFRTAALGVDPFQSLMSGLNNLLPIGFGTLYMIVNAVLLLFALVFDRSKIGLATLINLTLLGYVTEYSQKLFQFVLPETTLPIRVILLVVAIIVMCFGSALYFNADMGVSTYDAISLIISEKQKKLSFQGCRIISDFVCVLLGVLLCRTAHLHWREVGGVVGFGTIVTAFFMGPLINFFSKHLPLKRQ